MDHANLGPLKYDVIGEPASFELLSKFENDVRTLLDNSSSDYLDSRIGYELGIGDDIVRFNHRAYQADEDTEEACSWTETTMEVSLSNSNIPMLKVVYGNSNEPISVVPSCDEDLPLVLTFLIELQRRDKEVVGRELTPTEYELIDLLKHIACDIIIGENPYISARSNIADEDDEPRAAALILRDEIEVQSEYRVTTEGYRFEVANQDSIIEVERRWVDGNYDPHDPEITESPVLSVKLETSESSDPYHYEISFDGSQQLHDYRIDQADADFESDIADFRKTLGIGIPEKDTLNLMSQALNNAYQSLDS